MTDECRMLELESENARLRIENTTMRTELERLYSKMYHKTFNSTFKENVRDFFGRKCMLCGKHESEFRRRLSVHHIYDDITKDCYTTLSIPLCDPCHRRVHGDVDKTQYWIDYFTSIIQNQYDGKCYYIKSESDVKKKDVKHVRYNGVIQIDGKIGRAILSTPSLQRGGRASDDAIKKLAFNNIKRKSDANGDHSLESVRRTKKGRVTRTFNAMVASGVIVPDIKDGDEKKFYRLRKDMVPRK